MSVSEANTIAGLRRGMPEYRGSLSFRYNTKEGLKVREIIKRITEEERRMYSAKFYLQYVGMTRDEIIKDTYKHKISPSQGLGVGCTTTAS